jgi:acetylglutamate kinase
MDREYFPDMKNGLKNSIEYYTHNKERVESKYLNKAEVLVEALPYIKEYFNKTVVVKIGGSMMEDDTVMQSVLDDIILMKYVGIRIVLIHGGGKHITRMMKEKNIKTEFIDGLRVTGKETIEVAKMVLSGVINTKVVSFLNKHGKVAMGISGNDGNFIKCRKKIHEKDGRKLDLGYVGEIVKVDSEFLEDILVNGYIPVIATLGTDAKGNIYNINADSCASKIAVSLKATKMILLTDVDGIIENNGKQDGKVKRLVSRLTAAKCLEMIEKGDISSGMIPKVNSCIDSLKGRVERTHILNGTSAHSILIEIFTDKGIGTMKTI